MKRKPGRPRQQFCIHGHSLDDALQRGDGQRKCRQCTVEYAARYFQGIKADPVRYAERKRRIYAARAKQKPLDTGSADGPS